MKSLVLNPSLPFETTSPGRFHWYFNYICNDLKSDDGFNTKITNRIEIITNRIEINVISRVNATIAIWNHFPPVDYIDFNSICYDYNYICNDYNSFVIDYIIFLGTP